MGKFGRIPRRFPDTLYYTEVIAITNTECTKRMNESGYPSQLDPFGLLFHIPITDSMLCAIGVHKTPKTDIERLRNITLVPGQAPGDSGGVF